MGTFSALGGLDRPEKKCVGFCETCQPLKSYDQPLKGIHKRMHWIGAVIPGSGANELLRSFSSLYDVP